MMSKGVVVAYLGPWVQLHGLVPTPSVFCLLSSHPNNDLQGDV